MNTLFTIILTLASLVFVLGLIWYISIYFFRAKTCLFILKILTKLLDVDKDNSITIIFLGNDEIQISEANNQSKNYQF